MYGKTLDDFPERFDQFAEEFRGADVTLLDQAFAQGRSGLREFPTPADIRRYYSNLAQSPREVLQRDDKPTDWAGLGRRSGISGEQIAEWLEAGKDAQREYYAKLEADPSWRAMAAELGATPGLKKSEVVPTMTAEERQAWASAKAQDQGWRRE